MYLLYIYTFPAAPFFKPRKVKSHKLHLHVGTDWLLANTTQTANWLLTDCSLSVAPLYTYRADQCVQTMLHYTVYTLLQWGIWLQFRKHLPINTYTVYIVCTCMYILQDTLYEETCIKSYGRLPSRIHMTLITFQSTMML